MAGVRTDFVVNDDGAATEQNHPRIAVTGDGSFVVTWMDKRNGTADIYLQRFDSDGSPLTANQQVNDDTVNAFQAEPAIGVDLSGLYSIVWKDYRNGTYPFDPDVFFQRYDSAVSPLAGNRNVTTEGPDSLKETPDIDLAPWGGGVVVWADYRNRNWDIYGQLISSDGTTIGSNFKVNTDAGTAQQHAPKVDISPEGWFVVTWYDNRLGHDDIFVQRFDSLASRLGTNVKINSDGGTARQAFPDVATDGAGHFTVVWVDWRNGTYPANPDIYARRFDTNYVPVSGDTKVNRDGTLRAQREPAISADRRGNVAIIWSDSTGTSSWNIIGQMIDVDGVIREANFQANTFGDSAQQHPDVALDGRYRYITWTDKRNGNYDVYASIAKYNDPNLIPSPVSMRFEMVVGEDLPAPQSLVIDHAGYNPLHYRVLPSHSWLEVSPASGVTRDTVAVSIVDDGLAYGTYLGALTLVDLDNDDSSTVISVRLDVTTPVLALSTDTLVFRAFAGIDRDYSAVLQITNAGGGDFTWSAAESGEWLSLSATEGSDGDMVTVTATALELVDGNYYEPIVVDGGNILGSPDTCWVLLEVVANQPYLLPEPDSVRIMTTTPWNQGVDIVVHNAGIGILDWQASVHDPWLDADRLSGFGGDTIHLTIDTVGLPPGLHTTWIDVTDSASFNVTERIPFILDYLVPSSDTIVIGDLSVLMESSGSMPISVRLANEIREIWIPLALDTAVASLDSAVFDGSLPGFVTVAFEPGPVVGVAVLHLQSQFADSAWLPGQHAFAGLWLTAGIQTGLFWLDRPADEGLAPYMVTAEGIRVAPVLLPGEVRIDEQTGIDADPGSLLPYRVSLSQNYPNPFNLSTVIEFGLPERSQVKVDVYNILGQRVGTPVDGSVAAGWHRLDWMAVYENGRSLPSGVYFYRLSAGAVTQVRKMLLLK